MSTVVPGKIQRAVSLYKEMRSAREDFEKSLALWARHVVGLNRAETTEYRKLEDVAAEEYGDE